MTLPALLPTDRPPRGVVIVPVRPINQMHPNRGELSLKLIAPRPTHIRIYRVPKEPRGWYCGTERVWRVFEGDVEALTGEHRDDVYVCEHMVDCD